MVAIIVFDRLLQQIRAGEPAAAGDLYHTFAPGLRLLLQRSTHLNDVEEIVYATLLEATRNIRASTALVSGGLIRYIWSIAKKRAAYVAAEVPVFANENPAATAALSQVLLDCSTLDREILLRHYFLYESDSSIAAQLSISTEQLLATRQSARLRFREILAQNEGGVRASTVS